MRIVDLYKMSEDERQKALQEQQAMYNERMQQSDEIRRQANQQFNDLVSKQGEYDTSKHTTTIGALRNAYKNSSNYNKLNDSLNRMYLNSDNSIWNKMQKIITFGNNNNRRNNNISIRDNTVDNWSTAKNIAQQNNENANMIARTQTAKEIYKEKQKEAIKNTVDYNLMKSKNPNMSEDELIEATKLQMNNNDKQFNETFANMSKEERQKEIYKIQNMLNDKEGLFETDNKKIQNKQFINNLRTKSEAIEAEKEAERVNKVLNEGNFLERATTATGELAGSMGKSAIDMTMSPIITAGSLAEGILPTNNFKGTRFDDIVDYKKMKDYGESVKTANIENDVLKAGKGVSSTIGGMIPSIIANITMPGTNVGMITQALGVGGEDYIENLNEDKTNKLQSAFSGTLKGLGSYATEKITGGNILGKGSLDDWATRTIAEGTSGVENKALQKITQKIASKIYEVGGENFEELLENQIDHLVDSTVNNKGVSFKDWLDEQSETVKQTTLTQLFLNLMGVGGSTYNEVQEYSQNAEMKQWINEAQKIIDKENLNIDNYKINNNNINEVRKTLNELPIKNTAETKQESTQNKQTLPTQQITQEQNNVAQNGNMEQILPVQNYVYEKSENTKIDNLRKDANKYFDNSENTKNYINMLEKIIQDKDIDIRIDNNLTDNQGNIANGKYENGVITINPNSDRAGEFIAVHELTHAIGTDSMRNIIENYRKSNTEFDNAVKSLLKNYNTTELTDEAMADVSAQLFGNQEYINNLAQTNPSLFTKIYNEIKYLWHQFRGYKNQNQFIEDLQYKWEQAYRNKNKLNETANYYIQPLEEFNEKMYNNTKGLKLNSKEEYALREIVNSDSNVKPGINKVETTNATYTIYFKDIDDFKVITRKVDKNAGKLNKRDDYTGGKARYSLPYSESNGNKTTTRSNDEISTINKTRESERIGSVTSGSDNIRNSIENSNKSSFSMDNKGRKLSKEQQDYFKDSKILDRNGLLLTVYHGTNNDFNVFDKNYVSKNTKNAGFYGDGFYFTPNKESSKQYGKNSKEVYLDIKNPFSFSELSKFNGEDYYSDYVQIMNLVQLNSEWGNIPVKFADKNTWQDINNDVKKMLKENKTDEEIDNVMYNKYGEITERINDRLYNYAKTNNYKTLSQVLEEKGYDGIINSETPENSTEIVAFNSNQIKNIDNANPTSNPDIRYSKNNQNWQEYLDENIKSKGTKTNLQDIKIPVKQNILPIKEETNNVQTKTIKEASVNLPTKGETIDWGETERPEGKIRKHYRSIIESSNTTKEAKAIAKEMMGLDTYTPQSNENNTKNEINLPISNKVMQERNNTDTLKVKFENDNKVKESEEISNEETAKILTEPISAKNEKRKLTAFLKANLIDKGMVFEELSRKTGNRELQSKYDYTLTAEARGQNAIGNARYDYQPTIDEKGKIRKGDSEPKQISKSLTDIIDEVGENPEEFYNYMYHQLNIDRMTLEDRFGGDTGTNYERKNAIKNKPVFGKGVTAELSQKYVQELEQKHPEFKEYAQDVYDFLDANKQELVRNGVISQETSDLFKEMYPHYVPIARVTNKGSAINVPLDTGRTGINNPIKKAKGGNRDIQPLFQTMADRTLQTYRASAKNSFGVELKNTLEYSNQLNQNIEITDIDNILESMTDETKNNELLQKGENGNNPTFTVFENGNKVTYEISNDMYDALKPKNEILKRIDESRASKVLTKINNFRRGLLTEYNPIFSITNAIKDAQDVLLNSQHSAKTYSKFPESTAQILGKGYWYKEYVQNGGEQNSYFRDGDFEVKKTNLPSKIKNTITLPLRAISNVNNIIEMTPRLAEYISSREKGASIETAMLDASRVTTNFKAGGDVVKTLNRNGATFLNASVQGMQQQIRNIQEANAKGLKGYATLATKYAIAGLPALLLNNVIWGDDDDYEDLQDYVKDNYYIVGKTEEGTFIRIPKGRAVATIQKIVSNASDFINETANGNSINIEKLGSAFWNDLKEDLDFAKDNLAPNNISENWIGAPITQALNNKTWYGEDLVPTRLQDKPKEEQYDESTDWLSRWIGEQLKVSPMKVNYLLDQYSGGVGDVVLPMMTPQAENNVIEDKFTTNPTMKSKYPGKFFEKIDELKVANNSENASDLDKVKYKYATDLQSEINDLYKEKREIQNSANGDKIKKIQLEKVQEEINELTEKGLNKLEKITINKDTSTIDGNNYYKLDGKWKKLEDKDSEKLGELSLNTYADFKNKIKKETDAKKDSGELDENQQLKDKDKITLLKNSNYSDKEKKEIYSKFINTKDNTFSNLSKLTSVNIDAYLDYKLQDIKGDEDTESDIKGKTINGSKKEKVRQYLENANLSNIEKVYLYGKSYKLKEGDKDILKQYMSKLSKNDVINVCKDLTLNFEEHKNGNYYWK